MIKAKPLAVSQPQKRTQAGPVSAGRLKSFVERYEKLDEEQAAIGADKRDVLREAKGVGYDAKTIRWLVQERKIDAADRDERDTLRDVYAHALGMAVDLVQVEGLSLRQAEAATGISKSSIQRALAVPAVSQTAREMTADDLGRFEADAAPQAASPPETPTTEAPDPVSVTPVPDGGVGAGTHSPIREADSTAVDAGRLSPPSDPAADHVAVNPDPSPGRVSPQPLDGQGPHPGTHSESCGGRGVEASAHDNPAPHGSRLQQGPATTITTPSLPLGGTDDARGDGNVAKPETGPESAPRSSPPQDLFQRITGSFAPRPPSVGTKPAADDDDLQIPAFLRRVPA